MTDDWAWRAIYVDETHLDEVDAAGTEHGFAEVDQGRLVAFALLPRRAGLPTPVVRLDPASGQRPIFFRTRLVDVNPQTGAESNQRTITVLGWQRTVEGRNVQSLTALYDDGSAVLVDDRRLIGGI